MNAIKLFILDICLYVNKWALRTSTGREREELIQIWLRDISSCDPEATEPALGVYPWYASDPESYTPDTFQGNFRLRTQRCWDYYGDPDNVEPRLPPEPYDVDPKLCSFSIPFSWMYKAGLHRTSFSAGEIRKEQAITAQPTETSSGKMPDYPLALPGSCSGAF
jgi:hypothetical protein